MPPVLATAGRVVTTGFVSAREKWDGNASGRVVGRLVGVPPTATPGAAAGVAPGRARGGTPPGAVGDAGAPKGLTGLVTGGVAGASTAAAVALTTEGNWRVTGLGPVPAAPNRLTSAFGKGAAGDGVFCALVCARTAVPNANPTTTQVATAIVGVMKDGRFIYSRKSYFLRFALAAPDGAGALFGTPDPAGGFAGDVADLGAGLFSFWKLATKVIVVCRRGPAGIRP